MKLKVFDNRHIGNEVKNIEKGDTVVLMDRLSQKRWSKYFKYNDIDEAKLEVKYITQKEFFNMAGTKDNKKFPFSEVVANPPYQKDGSTAKRWTLWEEFVKKSKTLAANVTMVTPQSITSPGTFNLIKDHATVINIDVSKHFNVGSTFCYWTIDTTKLSTSTKIITDTKEYQLDLTKIDFLPATITDETLGLINTLTSRKARTWKRGELHTSNTSLFSTTGKYDVMHTNAQTLKSNTDHPNRTKIRVVVTLSGYPTFQVITNGYASQACFWTECVSIEDAQALANECNGAKIQKILEVFKWSGWNSKEVIKCL